MAPTTGRAAPAAHRAEGCQPEQQRERAVRTPGAGDGAPSGRLALRSRRIGATGVTTGVPDVMSMIAADASAGPPMALLSPPPPTCRIRPGAYIMALDVAPPRQPSGRSPWNAMPPSPDASSVNIVECETVKTPP